MVVGRMEIECHEWFRLPILGRLLMMRRMVDSRTDTTTIVGIDEAGYGPILGPLVVSAVGFEVPSDIADVSLWETLRRSVCNKASTRDGRLPILDSKKLYSRKDGLGRLERTALSLASAIGGVEAVERDNGLIRLLCPTADDLLEYPWYSASERRLPIDADAGGVRIAAAQFRRGLEDAGVKMRMARTELLPEGHFNQQVEQTGNKAAVSFAMVLRLIHDAARRSRTRHVRFLVDRQGGRDRYGGLLMRSFEDRQLKILDETEDASAYVLTSGTSTWRVEFRKSGDSQHLPIAAASIVSKYVRELLMGRFNAWWSTHVDDLRPTAGYYTDGLRFLRDIGPSARKLGIRKSRLVRSR